MRSRPVQFSGGAGIVARPSSGGAWRRTASAAAALAALWLVLLGLACESASDVPTLEQREQGLNRTIMCPVCPGESIDQSRNPLSAQMRGVVRDRLERGWNEGQITEYFVDSYGPSVLMEPPASGFSLLAWVVPPVALAAAIAALVVALRFMRRNAPEPEPGLTEEESEEYFARIEDALRR